jgi:signal transduction histidine kinase
MCLPHSIERLHKSIDQLNVTNEKLTDARQALIQSEKLANMGQLSAGIAHELNNPLGVITMYSNLLMEEMHVESENYKDLQLIVEQAERCKKIVGGLLNFARKNQVKSSEVNMVNFCRNGLETTIHPNEITLEFIPEIEDPIAYIDKDQMMQVLTNLLKNSVEAIHGKGHITLRLSGDEQNIRFEVKDNGGGIAAENMDKIFMPFFTTKGLGKGTGLGLPLIYGIIKMHKGDISVKSNNNPEKGETGTSFKIRIPRINSN